MPKICYVPRKFSADSQSMIDSANKIFAEYQEGGYDLWDTAVRREDEHRRLLGVVSAQWESLTENL